MRTFINKKKITCHILIFSRIHLDCAWLWTRVISRASHTFGERRTMKISHTTSIRPLELMYWTSVAAISIEKYPQFSSPEAISCIKNMRRSTWLQTTWSRQITRRPNKIIILLIQYFSILVSSSTSLLLRMWGEKLLYK